MSQKLSGAQHRPMLCNVSTEVSVCHGSLSDGLCLTLREDSHPAALPKQPYALSWWEAVRVLVDRQWRLTVRDGSLVRGRIIQVGVPFSLSQLIIAAPRFPC